MDFADKESLGIERTPRQIIGFERHRAKSNLVTVTGQTVNSRFRFRTVELVGLLMAQEPRVYQTKNLPTMEEASTAPTRPLDSFEKRGLAEIASGLTTFAMEQTDRKFVRMVGAIRANTSCLKCHACEKGELLGLMSYTIEANPRVSQTKP